MIGVFDSGVGGLTILKKIIEDNKEYNYIYYKDTYNNPYGGRSIEDLNNICSNICDYLIKKGAKIIVIACGTASTNCLSYLENKYKNIKFIPTYPNLEGNYKNTLVHEAIKDKEGNYYLEEMPGLADAIEHDDMISIKLILRDRLNKYQDKSIEHVVLGCTHYLYIEDQIKAYFKNASIVDSANIVSKSLTKAIKDMKLEKTTYYLEIIDSSKLM